MPVCRAQVRKWAEKNLFAGADRESDLEQRARRLVQQFGAAGFLKHVVPRQFGGVGDQVEARDLCILREELARGDALADTMFALQALGSYPITLAGDDEQKRRYLPQGRQRRRDCSFRDHRAGGWFRRRFIKNDRAAPG